MHNTDRPRAGQGQARGRPWAGHGPLPERQAPVVCTGLSALLAKTFNYTKVHHYTQPYVYGAQLEAALHAYIQYVFI
jgi:hypothetical protein